MQLQASCWRMKLWNIVELMHSVISQLHLTLAPKLLKYCPWFLMILPMPFLFYGAILTEAMHSHYDISNCIWSGGNWKLVCKDIKMQVSPT